MVVLVFLSAWGNDTLAYCTGRLIGKHKMSPILSPKKTVEGAIGGVIGAGLLGCLYGLFAKQFLSVNYNLIVVFGIVCAVGGLISIIGDLGASAIKRNYDIKDYSHLIPGHGVCPRCQHHSGYRDQGIHHGNPDGEFPCRAHQRSR